MAFVLAASPACVDGSAIPPLQIPHLLMTPCTFTFGSKAHHHRPSFLTKGHIEENRTARHFWHEHPLEFA